MHAIAHDGNLDVEVGSVAAGVKSDVAILVCALIADGIFHCGRVCPLQKFRGLTRFCSVYIQGCGFGSNLVRFVVVVRRQSGYSSYDFYSRPESVVES